MYSSPFTLGEYPPPASCVNPSLVGGPSVFSLTMQVFLQALFARHFFIQVAFSPTAQLLRGWGLGSRRQDYIGQPTGGLLQGFFEGAFLLVRKL